MGSDDRDWWLRGVERSGEAVNYSGGKQPGIVSNVVQRSPVWVIWLLVFALVIGYMVYQFISVGNVAQVNREARLMIRQAQLESCERVNTLREAHNGQNAILREFFSEAAAARLASGDEQVSREYLRLATMLQNVPLTDCELAFPENITRAGISP